MRDTLPSSVCLPAFTGPVIWGIRLNGFNPAAFLMPPASSGFYGNWDAIGSLDRASPPRISRP